MAKLSEKEIPTVKQIDIKAIEITGTNPRKAGMDNKSLESLSEDVKINGVVIPVKVRPKDKKYQLVYGERRYRASLLAGLQTIPAIVVEMDNAQFEKEQFIENMERQDVHPMDEAEKYAEMIARKESPYMVKDIAALIGKSESYILQRIELKRLLPELQNLFWNNAFNIAIAIELARISHTDQKRVKENCVSYNGEWSDLKRVKAFIASNIQLSLAKAVFKTDDATLYPDAGACTTCPKRSGHNLLFADIKEKDICFDRNCYKAKTIFQMLISIENTFEKHPDIIFLISNYDADPSPIIVKRLKELGIATVQSNTAGLTEHKTKMGEQKVYFINGPKAGKITTMYVAEKSSYDGGKKKASDIKEMLKNPKVKQETLIKAIDENITGINTRRLRSEELDGEKMGLQLSKEVNNQPKMFHAGDLTQVEWAALFHIMLTDVRHSDIGFKIEKELKIDYRDHGSKEVEKLLGYKEERFNHVARLYIEHKLNLGSSHLKSTKAAMMKTVAEQYYPDEIALIQAAYDEIAAKRKGRADERIVKLNEEKGKLVIKVEKKKVAKADATGKAAKKK